MLKLYSLTFGLLSTVMVAPICQGKTLQNHPTQQRINRELYVQKLVPIKKLFTSETSVTERAPVVETRNDKKNEPQRDNVDKSEHQSTTNSPQLQTTGRPEDRNSNSFGPPNERPLRVDGLPGERGLLPLTSPRR